jgi:hypothetical protein
MSGPEYEFEFDDSSYFVKIKTRQHGNIKFDWFNSTLFTHSKKWQFLDHILYAEQVEAEMDEGEFAVEGLYFWRSRVHEFDQLKDGMIKYDWPHYHTPEPAPVDLEEYIRMETADLRKGKIPRE